MVFFPVLDEFWVILVQNSNFVETAAILYVLITGITSDFVQAYIYTNFSSFKLVLSKKNRPKLCMIPMILVSICYFNFFEKKFFFSGMIRRYSALHASLGQWLPGEF